MMKRPPCSFPLLLLASTLVIVGLCGWFGIKPALGTCFDSRPKSLSNPPILPNAQQIEFGKSSFEPEKGYTGKLTQFQTAESPDAVFTFYLTSLGRDGWQEDIAQYVVTDHSQTDAKFYWECTTMSNYENIAQLWLHAEIIPSGKTVVTLNYEYVPR